MNTLSNMFSHIKNMITRKKYLIKVPYSNFKFNILKVLKKYNYIYSISIINYTNSKKDILFKVKSFIEKSVINNIFQISKSGRRLYSSYKNLPYLEKGFGITLLSSSKGIITNFEAKKFRIGGELICQIF